MFPFNFAPVFMLKNEVECAVFVCFELHAILLHSEERSLAPEQKRVAILAVIDASSPTSGSPVCFNKLEVK